MLIVRLAFLSATALLSHLVLSDISYTCSNAGNSRQLDIIYTNATAQPPCEVRYTKAGNTEVLWKADTEQGYCEQKANEFINQQESWGWRCTKHPLNSPETPTPDK